MARDAKIEKKNGQKLKKISIWRHTKIIFPLWEINIGARSKLAKKLSLERWIWDIHMIYSGVWVNVDVLVGTADLLSVGLDDVVVLHVEVIRGLVWLDTDTVV